MCGVYQQRPQAAKHIRSQAESQIVNYPGSLLASPCLKQAKPDNVSGKARYEENILEKVGWFGCCCFVFFKKDKRQEIMRTRKRKGIPHPRVQLKHLSQLKCYINISVQTANLTLTFLSPKAAVLNLWVRTPLQYKCPTLLH